MINRRTIKIVERISFLALILIGVYIVNRVMAKKDYGWIELNKVYNDFKLKQDLENKFKVIENERKKVLDSLELDLKKIIGKLKNANVTEDLNYEFESKRELLLHKREQFEEDNNRLRNNYNNQVLTQINHFVKEYAKENSISMIMGADGTGSVMYAEDEKNITTEIINFINEKYTGIK